MSGIGTTVQVVATRTNDDTQPTLMLRTMKGPRYFFGRFGEGFQRIKHQYRVRNGQLSAIFYTGMTTWEQLGGMPGFLLTLADQGNKKIEIYSGAPKFRQAIDSWGHFVYHENIDATICGQGNVFQDETLIVEPVETACEPCAESGSGSSTSYIVQMLPVRGKFLVKKAIELGVPKGAMFGQLTSGKTVVTPEGRTVTPDEVMEAPRTPTRMVVIDCPTPAHIASVRATNWYRGIRRKRKSGDDTPVDNEIRIVYHMLGADVDPFGNYSSVFDLFPASAQHYILHPKYSRDLPMLTSLADLTDKLRPVLPSSFGESFSAASQVTVAENTLKDGVQFAKFFDTISIDHDIQRVEDNEGGNNTADVRAMLDKRAEELESKTMNNNTTPLAALRTDIDEPVVITLGTGSAQPSKYRNVVSTLVRVPAADTTTHNHKTASVLLDSGEGTLGSLRRFFGDDKCTQLLQELELLYISHLHADHHLGCLSVIQEWMRVNPTDRQLVVAAPLNMRLFLRDWAAVDSAGGLDLARISFYDLEDSLVGRGFRTSSPDDRQPVSPLSANVQRIVSCTAIHCDQAYSSAIELRTRGGNATFKVAYSGDTRPNPFFATQVGAGAGLLVHEATHEDDLAAEARAKRHSTISEALDVAAKMRASHVVLTHFSQRYPKFPQLSDTTDYSRTALAFDGMALCLSEIASQHTKFPALGQVMNSLAADDADSDSG